MESLMLLHCILCRPEISPGNVKAIHQIVDIYGTDWTINVNLFVVWAEKSEDHQSQPVSSFGIHAYQTKKKERLTVATDGLREITAHHRVIGQTTDHNSLEVLVKERFFYFLFQIPGGV